jgi:hypothetical protein
MSLPDSYLMGTWGFFAGMLLTTQLHLCQEDEVRYEVCTLQFQQKLSHSAETLSSHGKRHYPCLQKIGIPVPQIVWRLHDRVLGLGGLQAEGTRYSRVLEANLG